MRAGDPEHRQHLGRLGGRKDLSEGRSKARTGSGEMGMLESHRRRGRRVAGGGIRIFWDVSKTKGRTSSFNSEEKNFNRDQNDINWS